MERLPRLRVVEEVSAEFEIRAVELAGQRGSWSR